LIVFGIILVFLSNNFESYATHVSQPILTMEENLQYFLGDEFLITGWVEYDGKPTSDVLLSVRILDPSNETIVDDFVTSDYKGEFKKIIQIPSQGTTGIYTVDVLSMCWQEHRQICTHKSAQTKFSVEQNSAEVKFPSWIKTLVGFWVTDKIDDATFFQVIEYLAKNQIITIPKTDTHEAESSTDIPSWIKTSAEFWIQEKISDNEFALGLEWLVNNGVIKY